MDLKTFVRENFVRFLALVCLLIGLADASRLLGVQTGNANPILLLGGTGFVLLSIFTLARLFAAVGLWINTSWGGVLLIGATLAELVLVLSPGVGFAVLAPGMLVRLALLFAITGFLGMRFYNYYKHVHD